MDDETPLYTYDTPDDTEEYEAKATPRLVLRNIALVVGELALAAMAGYAFGWALALVLDRREN